MNHLKNTFKEETENSCTVRSLILETQYEITIHAFYFITGSMLHLNLMLGSEKHAFVSKQAYSQRVPKSMKIKC